MVFPLGVKTLAEGVGDRVLREIFGTNRWYLAGNWRRLYNEGLHDLCCSADIIKVSWSRV